MSLTYKWWREEKRTEPNAYHVNRSVCVCWDFRASNNSVKQLLLSYCAVNADRSRPFSYLFMCVCIPVWLCQYWCITFELLWFQWLDMHEQQVDMTNNVLSSVFLLHRWGVCPFFLFPCIRTCFRFLFSVFNPFMVSFSSIGAQLDWICVVHIVCVSVCVTW